MVKRQQLLWSPLLQCSMQAQPMSAATALPHHQPWQEPWAWGSCPWEGWQWSAGACAVLEGWCPSLAAQSKCRTGRLPVACFVCRSAFTDLGSLCCNSFPTVKVKLESLAESWLLSIEMKMLNTLFLWHCCQYDTNLALIFTGVILHDFFFFFVYKECQEKVSNIWCGQHYV